MLRRKEKRASSRKAAKADKKPRRWRPLLKAAAVLALLGAFGAGFAWYILQSPFLLVETIYVKDAHALAETEIVEVSGISNEDNILLLDTDAIGERICAMPYVRACTVARMWPDCVLITVTERVAVATLVNRNIYYEIDADAVVLRQLEPDAPHPGPLITQVAGLGSIEPGQELEQPALRRAIEVWHAFSGISMARDVTVSEIAALEPNDIRMYCDELSYELRWGLGNFARQARRLDILWKEKGGELGCTEYLELRFDQDLACK
ncbi:MAG: FtsQ-type POTRA domain-containing protein [Candidatus Hydrogenedentes bacterium]|nr:FtsQ-type POTRA domain-containing protein [Candidatus Hydrogenedentota bacterium]